MRCITIMDGRFVTVNGEPASSHMDYESFARHFLTSFDEVVIVGRLFDSTDANARPVCGPKVRFLALPAYSGPEAFLLALPRIIKIFLNLLKDDKAAFLLRVPGGVSSIFSALAALKGRGFAVECTADTADQLSKGAVRHPLRQFFQWLSVKIVRWQCRKALVSTYVTHEALQRRYPPGRPEHSHYWTDIVLSDDTYVEAPRPVEAFNAKAPVLLNVGMMFQLYKGQDTLLQAARICKDAGVEVQIRFVGDGPYRKMLTEMTDSLGLTANVTFVGKLLGGKPVRDEIDAADVFVMPSRQEGLPRALLEAMARGAPCITSDVGGIPELMPTEDMIPANDPAALAEKLLALARAPEEAARKSARNLERARDYHYEIVRHRRAAFYKDLSTLARD
jgi:glycosyltransferase involved in cell wall biosynthesis